MADPGGKSDTQGYDLNVVLDQQAPLVELTLSENPADVGTPVLAIVSAVDDVCVTSVDLTLDGTPVLLDANGRANLSTDTVGPCELVATATDAAGNTGQDSLTLLVVDPTDVEAPYVEITSPEDGAVITHHAYRLGAEPPDSVEVPLRL